MLKPQRFEDLVVWQQSRSLVASIYRHTRSGDLSRDYSLSRQMQRSSLSIMSNIAEGFARRGDGEWSFFLNMALGSCAETKSHLYVALDLGYMDEREMRKAYDQLDEIAKMLYSLRIKAEERRSGKRPTVS